MQRLFIPAVSPPTTPSQPAWWFMFHGAQLLVWDDTSATMLPQTPDLAAPGVMPESHHYLGTLAGVDCYAAEFDGADPLPAGLQLVGLRQLYGRLDDDLFAIAGRAAQVIEWDRTHRYCGRCATPMAPLPTERAKKCPRCGLVSYPRLSPAIIVLVERGEEILLARGRNFPAAFYSILAGFVEPGESLEEAAARELAEEVGIAVCDLRYFGSQPWPYPHSLMIGFLATYAGGAIRVQESELADAAWFTSDRLPELPGRLSIARWMIDDFIARHPPGPAGPAAEPPPP